MEHMRSSRVLYDIADRIGTATWSQLSTGETPQDQLSQFRARCAEHPDLFGSLPNNLFAEGSQMPFIGVLEDSPDYVRLLRLKFPHGKKKRVVWTPQIDLGSLEKLTTLTPDFLPERMDVLFVDRCTEHIDSDDGLPRQLQRYVAQLRAQNPSLICIEYAANENVDVTQYSDGYLGVIPLSNLSSLIDACVKVPTRQIASRTARWHFDPDYQRARRNDNDGVNDVAQSDLAWLQGFLSTTDIPQELLEGITPSALEKVSPTVATGIIHTLSMANVWHREMEQDQAESRIVLGNMLHRAKNALTNPVE